MRGVSGAISSTLADVIGVVHHSALDTSRYRWYGTCVSTRHKEIARAPVVVQPSDGSAEAPSSSEKVSVRQRPAGVMIVGSAASENDFTFTGAEVALPDGPIYVVCRREIRHEKRSAGISFVNNESILGMNIQPMRIVGCWRTSNVSQLRQVIYSCFIFPGHRWNEKAS